MSIQNPGNMELSDPGRKWVYRIGGMAALLTVAVGFVEIAINFLPGGGAPAETVVDRFTQLQSNWFIGLRNLGLLNILMVALGIPMYFALYTAQRKANKEFAALAMIISLIGGAVFFATNRAFSMLELSRQYAQATTDAQRAIFEAAGQAMLSVGKSHCPGTFLGFSLGELAGVLMSGAMLRGKGFSKVTAFAGIIGFTLLLVSEVCISFVPALDQIGMMIALGGGVLNVIWMILLGRRLIWLARQEE